MAIALAQSSTLAFINDHSIFLILEKYIKLLLLLLDDMLLNYKTANIKLLDIVRANEYDPDVSVQLHHLLIVGIRTSHVQHTYLCAAK